METLTILLIGITSTLGFVALGFSLFVLSVERHCPGKRRQGSGRRSLMQPMVQKR